ncbi:FGGY-family carbohydrate kinase, partial [Escherichia coli]|uniref:FGGY-family carbohydrate kinase n=1 Tax=Escherichia coli TaxID=562 RepID=UPI0032E415EC
QEQGVEARRILLVGGGAQSSAVQEAASQLLGVEVAVPRPGEYVADGAARQAAAALTGHFPEWPLDAVKYSAQRDDGGVLARYRHYAGLCR